MKNSPAEKYSKIINESPFLEVFDSGDHLRAAELSEYFNALIASISSVSPEQSLSEIANVLKEIGGDATRVAAIIEQGKSYLDGQPTQARNQYGLEFWLFTRATTTTNSGWDSHRFVGDYVRPNSVVRAFFEMPNSGSNLHETALERYKQIKIDFIEHVIAVQGGNEHLRRKLHAEFNVYMGPDDILSAHYMYRLLDINMDAGLRVFLCPLSVADVIGLIGPDNTVLLDFCHHHGIQSDRMTFEHFIEKVREMKGEIRREELKAERKAQAVQTRTPEISTDDNSDVDWEKTGTIKRVINFFLGR